MELFEGERTSTHLRTGIHFTIFFKFYIIADNAVVFVVAYLQDD